MCKTFTTIKIQRQVGSNLEKTRICEQEKTKNIEIGQESRQ